MRLIRWLSIVVLILVVGVAALFVAARLSDGPIGMIAGGPLIAGQLVTGPEPDWRFAHDVDTVEFQLIEPPRSRRTWILEYDGKIYIPCAYMDTREGRLWKQWPVEAQRDGRAILRIDGKRYARQLVRIEDGPAVAPLTQELARKYGMPASPASVKSGSLWLFELAPPAAGFP